MALRFLTQPQHMIFVKVGETTPTDPQSLTYPGAYEVFVTIENPDPTIVHNAQVEFRYGNFGIGWLGGTDAFSPNPVIIPSTPPSYLGVSGQVTASTIYNVPTNGHNCITATLTPGGAVLSQNTTAYNAAAGTSASGTFSVYGHESPDIILTLTEIIEIGGVRFPVPAGASWNPLLSAPAGIGPTAPSPSPITLTGLDTINPSLIKLDVDVPAVIAEKHIFKIVGTKVSDGTYVGEVEITFNVTETGGTPVTCRPYVRGGYQSEDIILIDPVSHLPIAVGGGCRTSWDTSLQPNTDYEFWAHVHNDSGNAAINTIVRFWIFPGGSAASGVFLDAQTVTIPAGGSLMVKSAVPFTSAPSGQHSCAVVSIYNAQSETCTVDATSGIMVPDPMLNELHSCSAWRNTSSVCLPPDFPWWLELSLGVPHKIWGPGPVEISVDAHHVPHDWMKSDLFKETQTTLKAAGARLSKAMFLLPAFRNTFKKIDMGIKIEGHKGVRLEKALTKGRHTAIVPADNNTGYRVSGVVPKTAKKGDIILVKVTAHYPKTKLWKGRDVEFLQVIHVTDKGK